MLSEFILASISSVSISGSNQSVPPVKDPAIFKLPSTANNRTQPVVFKSSATCANGLVVTDSHIIAAQSAKATVNVYNIAKGNQEAIAPFPQKVTAITSFGEVGEYIILGFESGDIKIWEVCLQRIPICCGY
jgi:WD40 repeat protein